MTHLYPAVAKKVINRDPWKAVTKFYLIKYS